MIKTLDEVNTLVLQARNGDQHALTTLLHEFEPLIFRTSGIIYKRYSRPASIIDIINDAKNIFIILTLMTYDPHGVAQYPHYIKTHLHSELVKIYRPIASFSRHTVPLIDTDKPTEEDPLEHIKEDDTHKMTIILMENIHDKLNIRELDIIRSIILGVPRTRLAMKYHISNARISHIYTRCIKKLRNELSLMGIKDRSDI